MAAPLVTVALGTPEPGSDDPETVTFSWDFRPSSGPALKGPLKVRIEWRPLDRPPIQEPKVSVVRQGPTQVSSAGAAPAPASEDDDITTIATATVRRRFHQGVVVAVVDWTPKKDTEEVKGPQSLTKIEPVGDQVNADQTRVETSVTPRISELLRSPLRPDEQAATKTDKPEPKDASRFVSNGDLVARALRHVHGRLRSGLGGFWSTFGAQCLDAKGERALSELDSDETNELEREALEESWAQLVSEMIVGAAYNGPGAYLNTKEAAKDGTNDKFHPTHRRDQTFFQLVRQGAKSDDLVFPLVFACQQLSTMILMSRSADFFTLADNPFDSGAPVPNGSLPGKQTFMGERNPAQMSRAKLDGWLAPGVCFFRDQRIRHVATIIRAFKSERAQMLDTGGWNTTFPEPFNVVSGGDKPDKQPGIAYDTKEIKQLNDSVAKDADPPRPKLGVAIPPPVPDDKLKDAIRLLKRSRSLGVARLVIAKRGGLSKGSVLWVSRRLPMHEEAGEFHHYPITRLLASLRGCPHLDRLDVRWQLFVPEGQAALENAFENGRSVRWWETPPATATTDEDRAKSTRIKPVSEWGTGTDGVPRVLQRDMQGVTRSTTYPSFLTTLESVVDAGAQRKDFPELADVPNDQLPEYFRK